MRTSVTSDVQRLLAAFRGQRTDRVPYFEHSVGSRMAEHVLGRALGEGGMSAEDHTELALRIGMDAIGFGMGWGGIGRVSAQASDGTWHYTGGRIKTWDDLAREEPPDSTSAFEKLERYLEATHGTGVGVWVYLHGPFDPAYLGMGYEHFMVSLYDDLPLVEAVMDRQNDYSTDVLARICEYPVSFIFIADDVAEKDGMMIRPQWFRELWLPRLAKLVAAPRAKGIRLVYHSDGNVTELLPIVVEEGFQAINPIESYSNDIYAIKERWGKQITLWGNIDQAHMLSYATPDEVRADVLEHLRRLMPGGRYVLATGHSVVDSIPPENYLAMLNTWEEFGRYDS